MSTQPQTQWLFYAISSGACAALNGVFAKLTTTQLTTTWATGISHLFGFDEPSYIVEFLVRGFFFSMNLAFNAVMWGLFTRALTLASSTVRVSVINTSANFFITAILGALVFSEVLPALWWLGASMLVAGSVIIGRREEGKEVGSAGAAGAEPAIVLEGHGEEYVDEPDAPPPSVRRAVDGGDGQGEAYRDSDEIELSTARSSGGEEDDRVAN